MRRKTCDNCGYSFDASVMTRVNWHELCPTCAAISERERKAKIWQPVYGIQDIEEIPKRLQLSDK